jgi:hypothetical protein
MGSDSLLLAWNGKYSCTTTYKLGEKISNLDTVRENNYVNSFNLDKRDTAINFIPIKTIPFNSFSLWAEQYSHYFMGTL